MNASYEALKRNVSEFEEKIAQELQRSAKNAQAKRDQIQEQLTSMQAQVTQHETNIASVARQRKELESNKADMDKRIRELEMQRDEFTRQISFQDELIKNCTKAEKDSLLPYGRNIQAVLDQIERMHWRGHKPLGPLGVSVKAKDPQTWGQLLRSQLGQQLCSFAVTDPWDRAQLRDLFVKSGK